MLQKHQSSKSQRLISGSLPEQEDLHDDKYKKQQLFFLISNKNLSNFILIPGCGVFWVGGFIYANQNKISPIQVNLTRYVAQILSTFFILQLRNQSFDYKNAKDFRLLIIRSFISGLNGLAAAFFQMYLPLTVYYTINASTTMFAFILNYFLFGIHITVTQAKAVVAAMIGILFVINGRAIYQLFDDSYEFKSTFDYSSNSLLVQIVMGVLVMVWSLIWAYGIVITGKHHASFHQFILINSMAGYFMFGVMETMLPQASQLAPDGLCVRRPDLIVRTLLYCGVPMGIANYIFNLGLFISPNTGVSTMIGQVNILFVYFISAIRYGQQINLVCLLGGLLLIGGIYVTLFKK